MARWSLKMKKPTALGAIEIRPFGFIRHKVGSATGAFDILVQGGRAFRETKDDANDQANSSPKQPPHFSIHLKPNEPAESCTQKTPEIRIYMSHLGLDFLGSAPWADVAVELDFSTAIQAQHGLFPYFTILPGIAVLDSLSTYRDFRMTGFAD